MTFAVVPFTMISGGMLGDSGATGAIGQTKEYYKTRQIKQWYLQFTRGNWKFGLEKHIVLGIRFIQRIINGLSFQLIYVFCSF